MPQCWLGRSLKQPAAVGRCTHHRQLVAVAASDNQQPNSLHRKIGTEEEMKKGEEEERGRGGRERKQRKVRDVYGTAGVMAW